ncbi:MAG: nucleoside phosphorylase [Anaerolineae bacterium]
MQHHDYPILEYDPAPQAHIEPAAILPRIDIAPHCVLHFFAEVAGRLVEQHGARPVFTIHSAMGPHPVYEIDVEGRRLAVLHCGVGAPLAAGMLEELIAIGCSRFIAVGGAGVLDSTIAPGHVIVPTAAVRDEGTSYHYLPPAREVAPHPAGVAALQAVLGRHGIPYRMGKAWTTDAIYRETAARIARRREEGCLAVEMEAAAFFAVAQFRGVIFAQALYGGDDVGGETWDARNWVHGHVSTREKLFWLAAEACLTL